MPTIYDFRTAWLLHILSPILIGMCGLGIWIYQMLVGGPFPVWLAVAVPLVTVGLVLALRRTLVRSARLTDDAVEVRTWAGSRRIPLADVERPNRLTRSGFLSSNMRIVNIAGGMFAVPGYSRRATDFLSDLAGRIRT